MSKKNLLAVFVLATAGFFTSCSSDDDKKTPVTEEPTPNILEGTWKAETLSYTFTIPGQEPTTMTHPYDHQSIKQGCLTDYLTIKTNAAVELKENNKVGENCEDQIKNGTWTESTITITGENVPREITSVSSDELLLTYPYSMPGRPETNVTIKYSRQ